jgi:hypothetical protein
MHYSLLCRYNCTALTTVNWATVLALLLVVYTTTNYPDSNILITTNSELVVFAVNFNYEFKGAVKVN